MLLAIGIGGTALLMGGVVMMQRAQGPAQISLVQLISNPEKFDGREVMLEGFLRLEFEGNALYIHQEDDSHILTKNAIWVNATPEMLKNREQLDGHYVLLVGIFDAKHFGHMGLFAGELHQIKRAETWPSREDYEKLRKSAK